jgi:hypothetical protein
MNPPSRSIIGLGDGLGQIEGYYAVEEEPGEIWVVDLPLRQGGL